jgi:hypothetical protein
VAALPLSYEVIVQGRRGKNSEEDEKKENRRKTRRKNRTRRKTLSRRGKKNSAN